MAQASLLSELRARQESATSLQGRLAIPEHNPLDEAQLRAIESEIADLCGAPRKHKPRVTVLSTEDFQRALREIVPARLLERGLGHHFRVLTDPRNRHHVYVGPSALAGLNDGQSNVICDLLYHLVAATGQGSSLAFERGAADLIAGEVARRLGLNVFTDHYPQEQALLRSVIEAIKPDEEDIYDMVGLLKRSPGQFFQIVAGSDFYRWWHGHVSQDDRLVSYTDLVASLAAPNAEMNSSFMQWASQCAGVYRDYRQRSARTRSKPRSTTVHTDAALV